MRRSSTAVAAVAVDECCAPSPLASPLDDDRAASLAHYFAALGDPFRLKILAMILTAEHGEVCVCDFAERFGKKQPTVSHHLKVLGDAGLIAMERRGKWSWYSIRPEHVLAITAAIRS